MAYVRYGAPVKIRGVILRDGRGRYRRPLHPRYGHRSQQATMQRERRQALERSRRAIPQRQQQQVSGPSVGQQALSMLGDAVRNPAVQQAALQIGLRALRALPGPARALASAAQLMLPPPR